MTESSLEAMIERHRAWIDRYVGPWFGSLFLFGVLRFLLEKSNALHWAVGLAATLLLAALLGALLLGWRRKVTYSTPHGTHATMPPPCCSRRFSLPSPCSRRYRC